MYKPIRDTSRSTNRTYRGRTRFEHWHIDNQIYFITARCRDRFAALASEKAKAIFWERFEHWTGEFGFKPWIASLMDNHYHTLGYLRTGANLSPMMQRLHGSVAKLVNDTLPQRFPQFWRDDKGHEYFDGCIRDEKQCRLAYRYTLMQARRHGICADPSDYARTRVWIDLKRGVKRALELGAFLEGVGYKRYRENKRDKPAR